METKTGLPSRLRLIVRRWFIFPLITLGLMGLGGGFCYLGLVSGWRSARLTMRGEVVQAVVLAYEPVIVCSGRAGCRTLPYHSVAFGQHRARLPLTPPRPSGSTVPIVFDPQYPEHVAVIEARTWLWLIAQELESLWWFGFGSVFFLIGPIRYLAGRNRRRGVAAASNNLAE